MMMMCVLLPFVLFFSYFYHTSGAASCATLPITAVGRLANPCVGVVNYEFYVPNGLSLAHLQKAASDALNNTQLLGLTPNCQGALVRYACSLVYRKCQPNINLADLSTYNYYIYSNDTGILTVPLPIQRPCVSVCTSLSSLCADPLYVMASGGFPSCYGKYRYFTQNLALPLPFQYDLKNDNTQCYTPQLIPLSGPTEKYIRGSTPCNGIVDEYIVLPGNRLNANFTVLQPATVVQNIINTGLSSAFSKFPKWLTPECNTAIRQYFCYQAFFRPQGVSVRQALIEGVKGTAYQNALPQIQVVANNLYPGLLNRAIYFPRYANRSICQNYEKVCFVFRERAQLATLEPDCHKVSGGFELFPPGHNQTILTKTFPVSMGGNQVVLTLKFETEPDNSGYHNSTEMAYTVKCPPNYSLNPGTGGSLITKVPGSGCVVNCRTGFWTDDEWSSFDDFSITVSAVSLVFCIIVMAVIIITNDWKASYMVFLFTSTSLISSIYQLAITAGQPWEERFCKSEVIRNRRASGPSGCLRHSALSCFLYLVGCIIIFLMSVHRALHLTGNQSLLTKTAFNVFQFVLTFLPPLISIAIAGSRGYFGFSGASPWCSMDLTPSAYLMGFPALVICGFSYIIYLYATFRSYKGNNPAKVAVATSSLSPSNPSASGNTAGGTGGKGMTVISIGANSEVAQVRAFEDDGSTHGDPLFTNPSEAVPIGSANSNGNTGPYAPASDIEMKKLSADGNNAHVDTVAAVTEPKPVQTEASVHQLRVNIIASAFVLGSIIIHMGWVVLKFGNLHYEDIFYESMKQYTRCIFRNWDTVTTSSYTNVCGFHPGSRPPQSGVRMYMVCLFGNMLVMGPIYLIACGIAYWKTKDFQASPKTEKSANDGNIAVSNEPSISTA